MRLPEAASDQIEQREKENPDDIYQVPVEAGILNRRVVLGRESSLERLDSNPGKQPHPDQYVVVKGTAVHYGSVPYRYVVADDGAGSLVGSVNYGSILNIDLITDTDAVDIPANDGLKPNAALVAHDNIAYNSSVFCEVTICAKLW